MTMRMLAIGRMVGIVGFASALSCAALAETPGSTTFTLFDGIGVLEDITEYALDSSDLTPTEDRIIGFAAGHALAWIGDSVSLDVEAQAVRHYGRGEFWELGTTLVARFQGVDLPKWLGGFTILDGASIGIGPSFTTEIPPLEADRGRISHMLNQVMVELVDPEPADGPVRLIDRVHHRSGIYGLINGIVGGSDYIGRGLQFRF